MISHHVALLDVTVQDVIAHNLKTGSWHHAARSTFEHAKDTIIKWNKIMIAKEETGIGNEVVTLLQHVNS